DNGPVAAAPSSRRNVGLRAIEAHIAGGDRMCVAIVSEYRERAFEIEQHGGRHRRSEGRSTTDLNPHVCPVGTLGVETHALDTSRPATLFVGTATRAIVPGRQRDVFP